MTEEEKVLSIQSLISRCRATSPIDNNNVEYALDNQGHLKGPRKDNHSGTYILRALRAEDPLHFIRRLHQGSADLDSGTEELMTIIRSNSIETDDADNKKERKLSLITMALVKQFSEGKCLNKESDTEETEPLASSPVVKPDVDSDEPDTKPTIEPVAPSTVDKPGVENDQCDVTKPEPVADKTDKQGDADVEANVEEARYSTDHGLTDTKATEFESVSESDEKRPRESINEDEEPCVVPMTTDDDDEKSDTQNDVFAEEEDEAKEKANGEPAEALDLNIIPGSDTLNLDVGKHKVLLRHKSLTQRRKPSRSSIQRNSECSDEAFDRQFSYQSQGSESPPIVNGHCDLSDDADMGDRHDDDTDGRSAHTGHRLPSDNDTSMTQAPRSPILLPGFAEISKRPKKMKLPVPLPSDKSSDTEPSVPPWMAEMKQKNRRHKTPPRGESEKLQQEAEPEKPAWMKRESSSNQDSETPSWLRRTSTEPEPEVEKTTCLRSSNAEPEVTSEKASSSKAKSPPRGEVEKTQQELSSTEKPAWLKDVLAKRRKTHEILHSADEWESTNQKENNDKSTVQGTAEQTAPTTHKQPDLQKGDSFKVKDDRQVAPPKGRQSGDAPTAVASSSAGKLESEDSSSKHSFVHSKSMSPAPSSGTDSEPEPQWKAEVKQRKHKPYLQPKRPEQQLRLGELPDWKKELMEKNKRRGSDAAHPTPSPENSSSVPPWQKELAQRRGPKRSSISSKGSGSDREDEENVPEWARQARQLRRSRIDRSGVNNLDESAR